MQAAARALRLLGARGGAAVASAAPSQGAAAAAAAGGVAASCSGSSALPAARHASAALPPPCGQARGMAVVVDVSNGNLESALSKLRKKCTDAQLFDELRRRENRCARVGAPARAGACAAAPLRSLARCRSSSAASYRCGSSPLLRPRAPPRLRGRRPPPRQQQAARVRPAVREEPEGLQPPHGHVRHGPPARREPADRPAVRAPQRQPRAAPVSPAAALFLHAAVAACSPAHPPAPPSLPTPCRVK